MRNLIKFLSFFLVLIIIILTPVLGIPDQFGNSYQRAIVPQYDFYKGMNNNKIVFVGNSSLSYGLDINLMEQLTGKRCAILGNHAGFGMTYFLEMSKSNLRKGDIVVIEFDNQKLETCGTELLLTGIGKRFDMYRFIHPAVRGKVIDAYPSYLKKSFNYWQGDGLNVSGVYSLQSYDYRGNMIVQRENCTIPYPFTENVAKTYNYGYFKPIQIEEEFKNYLNKYSDYCKKLGVDVYYTTTYFLDEAFRSTAEEIVAYDNSLKAQLKAPLISNSEDHIFPRKYIYNAISHCNSKGAQYRTKLLYEDLKPYIK
ncbi:MAG: hypothetical protein J6R68_04050 [Clostridia bacterium]|nr:hypothetical protein [Clostridia bacterium]